MLGKTYNYIPPTNNEPNPSIDYSNYVDESLSLQGVLYFKNLGHEIKELSEECSISLSIKDEKKYNYVLIIENDDKSKWDKMEFRLCTDMNFSNFLNFNGNECLMWQKGMAFYILELFSDENIIKTEPIFLEKLSVLIASTDFQKPIKDMVDEPTRKEYLLKYGQIEKLDDYLNQNFKDLLKKNEEKKLIEEMNNLSLKTGVSIEDFKNIHGYTKFEEIYISPGRSFRFNKDSQDFIQIDEGESLLKVIDISNFEYLLILESHNMILVSTKIEQRSTITINVNQGCISFLSDKRAYSFGFKNPSRKELNAFDILINKCLYENINRTIYQQLTQEEKNFIDFNSIYEEEDEGESEIKDYKSIIHDFDNYQEMNTTLDENSAKNKFITQSYNNERAFVIKEDNTIDVYNTDINNNLESSIVCENKMTPFNDKSLKDKNINISGVKMYFNDKRMLFKDETTKDSIWEYDLGKEKVIQEWKCGKDGKALKDFTYKTKYGNLKENGDEMIGINTDEFFILDGRVNRKNKKIEPCKQYKTNPGFTCVTTPGFEVFATGAKNGDIRLYCDLLKDAKTLIKGVGDPIRGLDVTKDGKYVLATFDTYLLVINVTNDKNENGFTTPFKQYKSKPIELKLQADVLEKYELMDDSYTPAKFNLSKNGRETTITTSLGQFIIVWNFEDIKKGKTDSYKMTNVSEFVLDNVTKYDKNQILIAMPNKIRFQNEKVTDA